MKKFCLLLIIVFCSLTLFSQKIEGKVVVKGKPVENAYIFIKKKHKRTYTNKYGYFSLKHIPVGENTIVIQHPDFEKIEKKIFIRKNETINLSDIELNTVNYKDDIRQEIAQITIEDIDAEDESFQSGSAGLLGATQDVFTKATAWTWGPLRFRVRGYDSKYSTILLNGVDLKDIENYRPTYSLWGGLNDATRNAQTILTLSPSDYNFGSIGGTRNITLRASKFRKGSKISYAHTNRTYSSRVMGTYSTGLMKNNLAVVLSASRRIGQDNVYQEGTFYDAWAYFLSAEKKFDGKHSIGLIAFAAPRKRASYGASTQEIYDLTGNNYYNRYWGYQNGKKRNARIKDRHQPVFMLSHYWHINNTSTLQTTLSYKFGKYGKTRIERFDAISDRPDYYRDRPSYYYLKDDTETAQSYENLWKTNPPQVNWDYFYNVNYHSVDEIENANGINGYTYTGHRSKYILENQMQADNQWGINSTYRKELKENLTINAGITFNYLDRHNYKVVDDLLGGDYFVDIDQYARLDFPNDPDKYQSNLRVPNRIVKEGDKFGYDYNLYAQNYSLFGQGLYDISKFNVYFTFKIGGVDFQREGNMQNGLSPENSLGKSRKISFMEYGLKGGATYQIDGRNFTSLNLAFEQKAPEAAHLFIIPEENNNILSDVQEEQIFSGEVNYFYRTPKLKIKGTGYLTSFNNSNQRNISLLYANLGGGDIGFLYQYITEINKLHYGIELGADYELYPGLNIHAAAYIGKHTYTNNPRFRAFEDHTAQTRFDEATYLDGFYVNESPQKAYTFGLSYRHPKFFYVNADIKYLHDNYLQATPLYRTQTLFNGALENYAEDPANPSQAIIDDIVWQENLPNAFMMDLSLGKSIRFTYSNRMYLNLMVTNLFNNTKYITGGYEDMGYFGIKYRYRSNYYYSFGRTYYLIASLRF